VTETCRPC